MLVSIVESLEILNDETSAGPDNSPYKGGTFLIDIELNAQYPYTPPKMRFITKVRSYFIFNLLLHMCCRSSSARRLQVWHPNISSQTGAICLDILKDEWSPALGIKTALLSLQLLLQCPEPDDPQDAVVAKQYISNRKEYEQQALNWTSASLLRPPTLNSWWYLILT